jgi:hypothetical protein
MSSPTESTTGVIKQLFITSRLPKTDFSPIDSKTAEVCLSRCQFAMRFSLFRAILIFLCGVLIGNFIHKKLLAYYTTNLIKQHSLARLKSSLSVDGLYDESLANELFHEVKILCVLFTHLKNHYSRVAHVKDIWGK